jgi:phospholipase/carboxylesterase
MADFSLNHALYPARRGSAPHPGLLLLHGRGTDEHDLLPLARDLDSRLFTVAARAPLQFPWGGFAWYELDPTGVGSPDKESIKRSLELLRRFVGEILDAYPIDPRSLFVGGFSMGAAMSAALALAEPQRIAGAAILSGYVPLEAGLPLRPDNAVGLPIFEAHGALDQTIPIRWGRASRDYLLSTPVDLTYREYPIGHGVDPQELRDLGAWLRGAIDRRMSQALEPASSGALGGETGDATASAAQAPPEDEAASDDVSATEVQ